MRVRLGGGAWRSFAWRGGEMTDAGTPNRFQPAKLLAALIAAYAASVLFSVLMSRIGGQTSSIWTATGFLTAVLILLRGGRRIAAVALCLGFQAAVALAVGDGLARALLNPTVDLFEAAIAAWLAVTYCGVRRRRLSLGQLSLLVIGAIAPAAMLGASIGAGASLLLTGQGFIDGWLAWVIPSGLGMVLVTPAALLMAREGQYKEFRRTRIETVGLLGGVCVLTAAAFWQSELPLQFVIFPALTLVAFRLGPPGAAIAGIFVAVICLALVTLGHGPTMPALDRLTQVRLAQLVVAAAVCTTLAAAAVVADRSRLRRLLISRDRAARAARLRARDAEWLAARAIDARNSATARRGLRAV
jgi:integral membrane sensor domain MASE1